MLIGLCFGEWAVLTSRCEFGFRIGHVPKKGNANLASVQRRLSNVACFFHKQEADDLI
jgi:hypothetical protein